MLDSMLFAGPLDQLGKPAGVPGLARFGPWSLDPLFGPPQDGLGSGW